MAGESVALTKETAFGEPGCELFQVRSGVSKEQALTYAADALSAANDLIDLIVHNPTEQASSRAWAAQQLIQAAGACYSAVGMEV